jgi:predicted small metal-binding protein
MFVNVSFDTVCRYTAPVILHHQKYSNQKIFKTNKNMKTLHCSDAGFDCKGVISAETEQEVLAQAAEHALSVHGVSVTPELAEQLKTLIKEEPVKLNRVTKM